MKNIISAIIFLLVGQFVFAQQNNYKWRIGVHGGLNSYYGDLSSERIFDPSSGLLDLNNTDQIAYGLSVEKSISKAWGLRLLASRGQFTANDRTTNLDGDLFLDNENFDRALNAQTTFSDASLMMNYYFDNGKIFSDEAFISPYFGIGIGVNIFEVKGDLYDANGQQYYYWSDNTIRNMSEADPNASTAIIIEQDGDFETDLTALQTEGKNYETSTLTIPALIGLKFRLGKRFNFNLESLINYSGSDYMDDVHGEYLTTYDSPLQQYAANPSGITTGINRGNDDRLKDFYAFFSASLHYNFGFKKDAFEAPIFYLGQKDGVQAPSTTVVEEERTIIVNAEDLTSGTDKDITVTVVTDTIVKDGKTEIIEITIVDDEVDDNSPEVKEEGELVIEKIEWDSEEPTERVIIIETEDEKDIEDEIEERIIIIEEEPIVDEVVITEVERLGPVEPIETIRLSPTLTEEEIILADVQDAQIEVLEIENDIYDMQASGEKDTEKLDSLYTIIEALDKRLSAYENYHNKVAIQGNDDYTRPENQAIWDATAELKSELNTIRQEIRETSTSSSPSISVELYEKMQKDNAERIASLEKELADTKRKAEKDAKKAAKEPRKSHGWAMNESRKEKEKTEIKETTTVVVPTPVQTEKSELVDNEQNLEVIKIATETSANVKMLEARIASLEKSLTQQKKVNTPSTVFVPQQKDNASATQINALNQKIDQLSRELAAAKQALATKPTVVEVKPAPVVVQPTPAPTPAPTRVIVSAAKEAIRGYESTNIFFQTGQSSIATEFKTRLSTIATFMRQYPEIRAALTGYTDKSGNPEANFALSKRRSEAVKTYLLSQGVNPSQIEASYFGDTQAASANDPFSRRVEINLRSY